jgi:Ran GTPase-activating protein (RanGAP) involved in mRNA processing and transport
MPENKLTYIPTGNPRNRNLIDEKAARISSINFGRQITPSIKAFFVDLSGKPMTLEAVKKMTKYFDSTIAPAVTILNVSNLLVQGGHNNTMTAMRLIAKSLRDSPLKVVILSKNNLGSGGIKNLEDILTNKTLERLDVSNTCLGVQDVKDLFSFLRPRQITHLCLSNNPNAAGDDGQVVASFVKKCKKVVVLELSTIGVGRAGTLAITKSIHSLVQNQAPLECVNFSRFDFGDSTTLKELKAALGHADLKTLEHVSLANSCIPSTEYESLKDLLYYNNSGLTRNNIVLGNDTDGEEQESQFVELSMRG